MTNNEPWKVSKKVLVISSNINRGMIDDALKAEGLLPTPPHKDAGGILQSVNSRSIANCVHAVVDVSNPEQDDLLILGAIRRICRADDILVVRDSKLRAKLGSILNTTDLGRYSSDVELHKIVRDWAKKIVDRDALLDTLVRRIFESQEQTHAILYHCIPPNTATTQPVPLSGGSSGADLIKRALHNIGEKEPKRQNTHNPSASETIAMDQNLYVLDAPIQRGPTGELLPHNRVSQELWKQLETRVHFEVLPPAGTYHRESLAIRAPDILMVADALYDYGAVIRAPNPHNQNASVLILAGLHAPATHAAANVVVDPLELERLLEFLEALDVPGESLFFEAVFEVKRTYLPADLGQVKWLYGDLLRVVSQPKFDVFLSYNRLDKVQVGRIAQALPKYEVNPWLDVKNISLGALFQDEIEQAIPLAKSMAILIGTQGRGPWQDAEIKVAIRLSVEKKFPIVPVLLPGVDKIPEELLFLANHHCIKLSEQDLDEPKALVAHLRKLTENRQ
ncbi:MAG: toll/interleukin-1 receptor domain-containing protein [Planctomycetota bacterium]